MKYNAYWMNKSGTIIPLTNDRHITEIILNPEKFHTTKKDLAAIFKKHKEPFGSEGNAREEIMTELIKEGWVRIRFIDRSDSYTVQLWKLGSREKENLYDWATLVTKTEKDKKFIKNTEVVIMEIRPGGDITRGSLGDITSFKLFQESTRVRKKTNAVTFIEDYIARHKK